MTNTSNIRKDYHVGFQLLFLNRPNHRMVNQGLAVRKEITAAQLVEDFKKGEVNIKQKFIELESGLESIGFRVVRALIQ